MPPVPRGILNATVWEFRHFQYQVSGSTARSRSADAREIRHRAHCGYSRLSKAVVRLLAGIQKADVGIFKQFFAGCVAPVWQESSYDLTLRWTLVGSLTDIVCFRQPRGSVYGTRGVAGKVEHLDSMSVLGQPFFDGFGVMHP